MNPNAGYGKLVAEALLLGKSGHTVVVGADAVARRNLYADLFPVDSEGAVHFASTIDAAVGLCTANAVDRIHVLPGHTETISTATALALDVAGITIVGHGQGNLRPTITLAGGATTTIAVSAADVAIENVIFSANYADIASLFTLTTAKNFTLRKCAFKATAANMNFLAIVDTSTTDNAADGLTIEDCTWVEPDTATLYLVKGDADIDSLSLKRNYVNLGVNTNDLPALVNMATGKDLPNVVITDNLVVRLNDANPLLVVTDTGTANHGILARNFVNHADVAGELLVTATTRIGHFDNKATAAVDASGYLLPAADS